MLVSKPRWRPPSVTLDATCSTASSIADDPSASSTGALLNGACISRGASIDAERAAIIKEIALRTVRLVIRLGGEDACEAAERWSLCRIHHIPRPVCDAPHTIGVSRRDSVARTEFAKVAAAKGSLARLTLFGGTYVDSPSARRRSARCVRPVGSLFKV